MWQTREGWAGNPGSRSDAHPLLPTLPWGGRGVRAVGVSAVGVSPLPPTPSPLSPHRVGAGSTAQRPLQVAVEDLLRPPQVLGNFQLHGFTSLLVGVNCGKPGVTICGRQDCSPPSILGLLVAEMPTMSACYRRWLLFPRRLELVHPPALCLRAGAEKRGAQGNGGTAITLSHLFLTAGTQPPRGLFSHPGRNNAEIFMSLFFHKRTMLPLFLPPSMRKARVGTRVDR